MVTWVRLAEIAGTYLGKGQQVAIEGRLQTRSWDDERGQRHWKTEIVASHVEMLSRRRRPVRRAHIPRRLRSEFEDASRLATDAS